MSTNDELKNETANGTKPVLGDVLSRLHNAEWHFRLEDDEEGFYLSIINRQVYPRIWSDNFQDNEDKIICESPESLLERTVMSGKDWSERWFGESIDECLYKAYEWMSFKNIA